MSRKRLISEIPTRSRLQTRQARKTKSRILASRRFGANALTIETTVSRFDKEMQSNPVASVMRGYWVRCPIFCWVGVSECGGQFTGSLSPLWQ